MLFIIGYFLGYPEIGVIGAVLVLAAGVSVTQFGGLAIPSGHIEIVNNSTGPTKHIVTQTYQNVKTSSQLSIGSVTLLLGGGMILRALGQFSGLS